MLFTKLRINNFGKFHNREIELKPGINLIYGENEAGKSTVHTFMKGMLFGIERARGRGAATKDDIYTKYLPWDYPGAYNGQLDILLNGKEYRLQRSFHANDKSFTVLDLETGREVKLKEGLISELIPGLTESAYKNTVSIEQLKAQTDSELASQVRNYITNLSIAKSKEVNVSKAVASLNEQRKALEATLNTSALKNLQTEIEEGLDKEEKIDALTIRLRELLSEEQGLKAKWEAAAATMDHEMAQRIDQLPAILEKYRSYKELVKQVLPLEKQIEELKQKLILWETEADKLEGLKRALKEAGSLSTELPEQEKKLLELKKNSEAAGRSGRKRNLMITLLPAGTIGVLTIILLKSFLPAIGILAVGALLFLLMNRESQRRSKSYEDLVKEQEAHISGINISLKEVLQQYKVSSLQELSLKQEEILKASYAVEHGREQYTELNRRKGDIEDQSDLLQDTIMQYLQYFISEEELRDDSVQKLQEVIRQKKQETNQRQSEITKQYNDCKLQIEKLRWEISAMEGNEEQLLKNKEQYVRLEQQQKENAVELEAVRLALSTIQGLSADIHDSFGRQLNLVVSGIIDEVTEHRYSDLKVDEKLEVKVGWNGDYVLLDRLSAGTMDQVYFALRLAVADLLLGNQELPMLFDDSFALYDENRMKAAISQVADRGQLILFSCHKREQQILEELKLPYHYVELAE
jgi:uncharacterized protein YhaN